MPMDQAIAVSEIVFYRFVVIDFDKISHREGGSQFSAIRNYIEGLDGLPILIPQPLFLG